MSVFPIKYQVEPTTNGYVWADLCQKLLIRAVMNLLEQIQEVEQRLRQAMLASDVDALNVLLAEDVLAVGPDGQLVGKAEDLAVHRSGMVRIKSMIPLETTIKLLPDVAIVFVLMDMQVLVQDQLITGRYRYTRVWSQQTGNWQITAAHISAVPTY